MTFGKIITNCAGYRLKNCKFCDERPLARRKKKKQQFEIIIKVSLYVWQHQYLSQNSKHISKLLAKY